MSLQIRSMTIRRPMALTSGPNNECSIDFTDAPDSPIVIATETNELLQVAAVLEEIDKLPKFIQNPNISILLDHIQGTLQQINLQCAAIENSEIKLPPNMIGKTTCTPNQKLTPQAPAKICKTKRDKLSLLKNN